MNGYDLSRQWFSFAYENTEVRPIHTALYFWIVERANSCGWKKIIDIQTEKSMECLGVTDWRTYKNALQFLADNKLILWLEKSKNQYTCNRISLSLEGVKTTDSYSKTPTFAYALNAEAVVEAIAEAYAEPHVEAIAEALQSYINLKTRKPKNPKTSKRVVDLFDFKTDDNSPNGYRFINPFEGDSFPAYWERWKLFKKEQHNFTYKSSDSELTAIKKLHELSKGSEEMALKIIEQSIFQGWSGLFALKQQPQGDSQIIPGMGKQAAPKRFSIQEQIKKQEARA